MSTNILRNILIFIVVLWLLGFVNVPFLTRPISSVFGSPFNLQQILVFVLAIWAIKYLPSPFQQIAMIFIFIWLLSILGIFGWFGGLGSMILGIFIIWLILSLLIG